MSVPAVGLDRMRSGWAPFVLYPLLALLAFPTLGTLIWGRDALLFAHDLLDIPRSGIFDDWAAYGPSLWNTHVASGNALLVQQAIGPFAIDVPIGFVFGPFGALAINGWLLGATAGISMHLFLRDCLRLSTLAVVVGATLYAFAFWHPIIGFPVPLIPLLLWLAEGLLGTRPGHRAGTRWRYAIPHVLAAAFAFYNGQSQVVVLIAVLELAYLLLAVSVPIRRLLVAWTLLWAAAIGLYAPALLSQLPLLGSSQRINYSVGSPPILRALLAAGRRYASVAFGVPIALGLGRSDAIYGTFYLGLAGLPLLAAGVLSRPSGRARFVLLLLVAIPILDVVLQLGGPLRDALGPLRSFKFDRIRHLFEFALVASAAYGLDALPAVMRGNGRRVMLVGAAALPVAACLAVAAYRLVKHRDGLAALDPTAIGWLLALVAGLAAVVLFILVARWVWSARRPVGWLFAAVLLVVLVGERTAYQPAERLLGINLASWHESLDATPAQEFLLRQPGISVDRVLSFGEDANRAGTAGLLQADGYQVIYPAAYQRLFGAMIRPTLSKSPARARYFDHWGNRAIAFGPDVNPRVLALLGVRWLYVRQPPGPPFNASLYRNLPWVPTVPGIVERYRDPAVVVYEVPDRVDRAFLAGAVVPAPNDSQLVKDIAAAPIDELSTRVWVTAGAAPASVLRLGDSDPSPAGSARIASYRPDEVVLDVDAARPAVAVLTDVWDPSWTAEVDGAPAPIARVDSAFRGVPIDAGRHRIILRYRPVSTYLGFLVAGVTALLVAVSALWLRRRDRLAEPGHHQR